MPGRLPRGRARALSTCGFTAHLTARSATSAVTALANWRAKLRAAGFEVEKQFFFNKVGRAGLVRRQYPRAARPRCSPWQLKLYNALTPLFRVLDRILPTAGLSTVVVGRKPITTCLPAPLPAVELVAA